MKKIFAMAIVAATMLLLASCKDSNASFVYSVSADGDAKGNVTVTFPDGHLNLDGAAALDFDWSNDTTFTTPDKVYFADKAVYSNDKKVVKAANAVNDWAEDSFSAASASGDYYLRVAGYAKEPVTGLTFYIDKTYTNRK